MKTREILAYAFSALIVIAFFCLLFVLSTQEIPKENKDILTIAVGALIGAFTGVVSYCIGSSIGSKMKTEMLNKQLDNLKK